MRDKRFVAIHRGGILRKEQHFQLTHWACCCAKHVFPFLGKKRDKRLKEALKTARLWQKGERSVGDARKASLSAIAAAHQSSTPIATAVARAVGHAVATAHMADHSLRAAEYALKAVKLSGKSVRSERKWQDKQLTPGIRKIILSIRKNRIPLFF